MRSLCLKSERIFIVETKPRHFCNAFVAALYIQLLACIRPLSTTSPLMWGECTPRWSGVLPGRHRRNRHPESDPFTGNRAGQEDQIIGTKEKTDEYAYQWATVQLVRNSVPIVLISKPAAVVETSALNA
jgi:hypothetical protein